MEDHRVWEGMESLRETIFSQKKKSASGLEIAVTGPLWLYTIFAVTSYLTQMTFFLKEGLN